MTLTLTRSVLLLLTWIEWFWFGPSKFQNLTKKFTYDSRPSERLGLRLAWKMIDVLIDVIIGTKKLVMTLMVMYAVHDDTG